ncbi:MAG: glycoside hydrolase family 3 N-terminal domain-containing protein [Anaerolineales bacterium]
MRTLHPFKRILLLFLVCIEVIAVSTSYAAPKSQVQTTEELARELLSELTPEERVGQLFVVDFQGSTLTEDSDLFDLITNYHIGGVNLKASNNNIPQDEDALQNLWLLIQDIQRTEINNSLEMMFNPDTEELFSPAQIPLFIATTQDGDGYPGDQILNLLTTLPSQFAIGATWDTELARQSGQILAKELSSLGVNLLLGPSLNVHVNPRPELAGDLGTNSFSGSPFWVGEMGKAYITGIHQGSNNKLAVISKNFPGFVGADQPLSDEIPAVRKTLDQLLLTELPPFTEVTDLGGDPNSITNGLLLTHARYQAFQSNISTITPPITLDPQALSQLLSLQEFSTWHENGGLIVSDELGTQAIRRYYIQIGQKYDPRFLSRDALLAGNDLILTGNFIGPDSPNLYTSIVNTLNFFAQKYKEDVAFAQLVDDAVLRILIVKYQLYNNSFNENNILFPSQQLDLIGQSNETSFEVARNAATLINPAPENLNNVLPNAPSASDFITIFTDTLSYQACSDCPQFQTPAANALEMALVRLYGPSGDGLIVPGNVASYTFRDLNEAVSQSNDPESLLIANIQRAEWLVFLQLDHDPARPASLALSRFLSETPELLQDKKIVVFGLNAPYFLNATEVSTVSAYYGLYSKQPQFIEVAARLLFKEINASGAAPVTVNSVGYILDQALTPNSEQTIPLRIIHSDEPVTEVGQGTPTPTPLPFNRGDIIILESGPILDYNGNPVRDDTLVRFTLISTNPDGVSSQREVTSLTVNGVAQTNFILDTAGTLSVQASSGQPPATSAQVQINVSGPTPTETEPGDTPPPSEITPTVEVPLPTQTIAGPREVNNLIDWLLSLLVIFFISLFAYQSGALAGQVRWGVRFGLTALIGGLAVNAYISFNLPGAAALVTKYSIWGIVLSAASGSLIGWASGVLWRWMSKSNQSN